MFEAMLAGWDRQQRVRSLKLETIRARLGLVRRLAVVSNQYPWQWTAGEVEAFFAHLRSDDGAGADVDAARVRVCAAVRCRAQEAARAEVWAALAPPFDAITELTDGLPPMQAEVVPR